MVTKVYQMIKQFSQYKDVKKIMITENGAAFPDKLENVIINDTDRLHYLQSHLEQVYKTKQEGVDVAGYFVWTFTDNFEWAEGYHPRFGLVYTDFETQERIIKNSGKWYQSFLDEK